MASASDRSQDRDQSSIKDERGNPFVTFSRLVDQQISSFFRGLSGLSTPSTSKASLDDAEQQRLYREEVEDHHRFLQEITGKSREQRHENFERWRPEMRGKKDSYMPVDWADHSREQPQSSDKEVAEARRILGCVRDATCEDRAGTFDDDDDDDVDEKEPRPRCPYRPTFNNDHDEDEPEEFPANNVLVMVPRLCRAFQRLAAEDYLTGNPYSPLQIEDQDLFREHGARWRKAFEDLLAVQQGLEPSGPPSTGVKEDKEAWMSSLQKRGFIDRNSFCSLRSLLEGPTTRQPENDAEEDALTELAVYQQILGSRSSPNSASINPTLLLNKDTGSQSSSSQPSVISTMTTTQRRTLPDGSVYTKVVLKKGFSDGSEEATETEHTMHNTARVATRKQLQQQPTKGSEASTPSLGYDGKVKQAIGQKIHEKKNGGWFWS